MSRVAKCCIHTSKKRALTSKKTKIFNVPVKISDSNTRSSDKVTLTHVSNLEHDFFQSTSKVVEQLPSIDISESNTKC